MGGWSNNGSYDDIRRLSAGDEGARDHRAGDRAVALNACNPELFVIE